MPTATAVRYHETGKPEDVLRVEEVDVPMPGAGEVLVALRAAAINPSDLGMISGSYGRLRELPAIAGREGVGEVLAVGEGVSGLPVGSRVRMPDGAWTSLTLAEADELMVVPGDLPVEQAAMAFVNPPTVVSLLTQFVDLKPGDWLIQNAGNSALGIYAAQLARKMGCKMISVVRDPAKWESTLKENGAELVIEDSTDYPKSLKEQTGGAKPRLALNSVGGESVNSLIKCMADGGTVVTFGGMTGEKTRFPTRFLIFNDVRLRGFWMDRWFRNASTEEAQQLMQQVYALIGEGTFQALIDSTHPLENGVEAVMRAATSGRNGKVLITSNVRAYSV